LKRNAILLALSAAMTLAAGSPAVGGSTPARVRSVVRTTSSGRLVRAVVVSPKLIPQRLIDDAGPAASSPIAVALEIPGMVEAAAKKYDVDPLLVHSVIQVESNYNPYALSNKGAQGLMQLMPATARRFGVSNSFDPKENLEGGVRYLKYLQSLFPADLRLAIAAYNAGEGAVWKYNNQIPPYRETEQYVYLVGRKYGEARRKNAEKSAQNLTDTQATAPEVPAGPSYSPVESFVDAEGRLHLRSSFR